MLSSLESPGTRSPLPFLTLATTTKVETLSLPRFAVTVAKPCLTPLTSPGKSEKIRSINRAVEKEQKD